MRPIDALVKPTRRQFHQQLGLPLLAGLAGLAPLMARGQATPGWPDKPLRIIVPAPAGGISDVVTRSLGQHLSAALGQPVIVDNKPGAGGTIGTAQLATSKPDGLTLAVVFDTYAVSRLLYRLPFDPARDLAPVGLICTGPLVLAVPAALPVSSVSDLVALAKAKKGGLNYASTGAGSSNQLAAELFRMMAGIDLVHVPYKGGVPAITDLIGGQVDLMFVSAISVLAHIKAGRLKALAVTTRQPIPQLTGVPTVGETYPGFEARSWIGLLAPGQTPPAITQRLNHELRIILETTEIKDQFRVQALQPAPGTPEDFSRFLKAEADRWSDVIRKANIQGE